MSCEGHLQKFVHFISDFLRAHQPIILHIEQIQNERKRVQIERESQMW